MPPDVYAIARHIAEEADLPTAYRFVESIDETAHLIATQPEMGRKREDVSPRLRSFPVGPFVLFYRALRSAASRSPAFSVEVGTSRLSSDRPGYVASGLTAETPTVASGGSPAP